MNYYQEQLDQLRERIARKRKLSTEINALENQRASLAARVQQLKEETYQEQLDVDKLENFSAAKLFAQIMGNLDERLEKERSELYAAALRYDSARQELHAVEADLAARREELSLLGNCEAEYDRLLEARARELRQDPQSPAARRLLALEERQAQLASREKELQEAIQAGYNALSDISSIESALSSAEGWGTWDVFGGGLISDMAKYSHLDDAQQQINGLQRSLSRFRTELADVDIRTGIQIEVDSFLRFADYFFDNIFTDWAVLDRIRHTQSQIHEVDGSVRTILSRLERDLEQCRRDRQAIQQELKDFLVTATYSPQNNKSPPHR